MLGRDAQGEYYLGTQPYIGDHGSLWRAMNELRGENPLELVIGGEFRLENGTDAVSFGTGIEVNESSGFVQNKGQPLTQHRFANLEDVALFKEALQRIAKANPETFKTKGLDELLVVPFNKAEQHLDTRLNKFGDNVRHRIQNAFGTLSAVGELATYLEKDRVTLEDLYPGEEGAVFRTNLNVLKTALQQYYDPLTSFPTTPEQIHRLQSYTIEARIERLLSGDSISTVELKAIELHTKLAESYLQSLIQQATLHTRVFTTHRTPD